MPSRKIDSRNGREARKNPSFFEVRALVWGGLALVGGVNVLLNGSFPWFGRIITPENYPIFYWIGPAGMFCYSAYVFVKHLRRRLALRRL